MPDLQKGSAVTKSIGLKNVRLGKLVLPRKPDRKGISTMMYYTFFSSRLMGVIRVLECVSRLPVKKQVSSPNLGLAIEQRGPKSSTSRVRTNMKPGNPNETIFCFRNLLALSPLPLLEVHDISVLPFYALEHLIYD